MLAIGPNSDVGMAFGFIGQFSHGGGERSGNAFADGSFHHKYLARIAFLRDDAPSITVLASVIFRSNASISATNFR